MVRSKKIFEGKVNVVSFSACVVNNYLINLNQPTKKSSKKLTFTRALFIGKMWIEHKKIKTWTYFNVARITQSNIFQCFSKKTQKLGYEKW